MKNVSVKEMNQDSVKSGRFQKWKKKFIKEFRRDWQLHLFLLIPVIYIAIFSYGPMYGIQLAFRDFNPLLGITKSEWVGLQWFRKFMGNYKFAQIFKNTVVLSLYGAVATFPLPILFALFLNSIRSKKFVRITQTISYMPHFISVVVLVSIMNMVFSPISGVYGNVYRLFGGTGYPVDFRASAGAFRHLLVWSAVWQSTGWNSIIYIAALSSVSPELHEAARIDGATRFQRIIHIDLPAITPTIAILLIMRVGHLVGVGFEKAYLLQTPMNLEVSEVISTYVYKVGLGSFKDYSYGAAIGLFNTVINVSLLILTNYLSRKMTEDEISLF